MIYFIRFLLAILIMASLVVAGCFLTSRSDTRKLYREHKSNADFILPFEKFKSMYYASPEKYALRADETVYNSIDEFGNGCRTYIGFTYSDYKKYIAWKNDIKKNEEYEHSLRIKQKYLKSVQADIKSYKEEINQELEKKHLELRQHYDPANSSRL